MLAGEEFRKYWRELVGAELADLPAPELLDRIREGMRGAELVHAFPCSPDNPRTREMSIDDWNLTSALHAGYYPNQRTMYFVGIQSLHRVFDGYRWSLEGSAETKLMGYPEFTARRRLPNSPFFVKWPASLEESYNRPIYSAGNYQRSSLPIPTLFGNIQVVFARKYVDPGLIIAASDTGWKAGVCHPFLDLDLDSEKNRNDFKAFKGRKVWDNPKDNYNCSAWPFKTSALGVVEAADHLIIPNVYSAGPLLQKLNVSFEEALARQYARLLDDDATSFDLTLDPLVPDHFGGSFSALFNNMYHEYNIGANVFFHDYSIKLVLASFSELFGSIEGKRVQQWSIQNQWLLAWGLSSDSSTVKSSTWRMLDPHVAGKIIHNVNLAPRDAELLTKMDSQRFWDAWANVSSISANKPTWEVPFEWMHAAWDGLTSELESDGALIRVPRTSQCSHISVDNPDACVGVTKRGDCVCYDSELKLQRDMPNDGVLENVLALSKQGGSKSSSE